MNYFLRLFWSVLPFLAFSQVQDDFTDGNFSANPAWTGDDTVFTVISVNGNPKLRSDKAIANSTFYLATPSTQVHGQWEFSAHLAFNTSSTNYADVFLVSDRADLKAAGLNAWFVRIGNTADEVSLYKRVAGVDTKVIDGVDGVTNTSNNNLKVKITRDEANLWELQRDMTGTGNEYISEGTAVDDAVLSGGYAGIFIRQSTASFFFKHFFDDIYIGPVIVDTEPPAVLSVTPVHANKLEVLFSEKVEQQTAQNTAHYALDPVVEILHAWRDPVNFALVHLELSVPLANGLSHILTISGVSDLAGNVMDEQNIGFTYLVSEIPMKGDVIIHEFMCDPSPVVGLPELEFVEIYNRTNKYFNLAGWKLGDNASEGTVQQAWLVPGEHKVLCATSSVSDFPGSVGVTSFPSLNNGADDIVLKSSSGVVLDKISYEDTWYKDALKKNGGYTLELINPDHPCSDASNWKASMDPSGGTPGLPNSVLDLTPDTHPPVVSKLLAMSPNYLQVDFNEGLDSLSVINATSAFDPGLTIANIHLSESSRTRITYEFQEQLVGSQPYVFRLQGIADCWMNSSEITGKFALPEVPQPGDLVINEILFNPVTGGSDFVEIRNNSQKLVDLYQMCVANYSKDTIANLKTIPVHWLLHPGEYVVLTPDPAFQLLQYPASVPGRFIQMPLPAMNNDAGTVLLISDLVVIDQVSYSSRWHFRLLDNDDGKSLEKIDPAGSPEDPKNWHTAAESIGFATPGGENSQFHPALETGDFSLTSEIISPDNDGVEDVLQINYKMISPGMVGNITIYDDRGRLIRKLARNELLSTQGSIIWDGIADDNQKAGIGIYVLVFEAFNIQGGDVFAKRKAFTVAGNL